ncbi:MAG: hypothetical protein BAA01_10275 [Bacillus thermozeamaize]|uniref:S-adenosyl-L-homocysteine hydrolase NAD binding domain-containing protein n=1 Tax=Bacillus thermozeamaize TaxID=230954 RepID=A0A1Y3PNR3_9BACI|nr:MAG: hypothetical protein BAA01_10275 [Bacillus thermozeamaize]
MKIVVGASSFAEKSKKALNALLARGIEVVLNPYGRKMTKEEIIDHLKDADGLLAGLETIDAEVLDRAPKLKAIARIGIGMDNIDIDAAHQRGIKVSNTPDAPTEAVGEMVLAALLAISRQIIPLNADMHNKIWKKRIGFSLHGKTVLIIGYGRIGQKVAELLKLFGTHILIYDPNRPDVTINCLEDGLQLADIISLHASGNSEILNENSFSLMKRGVVILNSARGNLINENKLYEALKSGLVAWYWGDVHPVEPYYGKLTECENAILTPHTSTYTDRCRELMEYEAAKNILRDLGYE